MVADLALGVVMPIHSHISVNGVISDYVPKAYMGADSGFDSRAAASSNRDLLRLALLSIAWVHFLGRFWVLHVKL